MRECLGVDSGGNLSFWRVFRFTLFLIFLPKAFAQGAPVTFSPVPGTYAGATSVTISTPTLPNASLQVQVTNLALLPQLPLKTFIGSSPLTIPLDNNGLNQVYVLALNPLDGANATVDYTINLPTAATPTFSPAGGSYQSSPTVSMFTATPGAAIYYTTNGLDPTNNGNTLYTGPIAVNNNETVQAITVEDGYLTSAVASATYTVSPPTPTPQFIDPVSSGFVISYSGGTVINTDTDLLALGGTTVVGAAADGITQFLIRVPATHVGQQFNLTLLDETGTAGTFAANGGLFPLGGAGTTGSPPITSDVQKANNAPTSSLPVTAVSTPQGPMAFAVYATPIDFTRSTSDETSVKRSLALQLSLAGAVPSTTPFVLVRPPVVLVHGLWASPDSWDTFTALPDDPLMRFVVYVLTYDEDIEDIQSITPTDSDFHPGITTVDSNAVGFVYNAKTIESQIQYAIDDFRASKDVAAWQADVVAHSMGGMVTRSIALLDPDITAGVNLVHKLITIGTPHLGSPLATRLLSGDSECSRQILADNNDPSYSFVAIGPSMNSVTYIPGAVGDLMGNGDGTGLTPQSALQQLATLPLSFPTAYIGGTSSAANLEDLGGPGNSGLIQLGCALAPSDQIVKALTRSGWGTIFSGAANDSVVPLTSQLNLTTAVPGLVFSGLIHSQGLEDLDFLPPTELDHSAGIDSLVIDLLNAAVTSSKFHPKGQRP